MKTFLRDIQKFRQLFAWVKRAIALLEIWLRLFTVFINADDDPSAASRIEL